MSACERWPRRSTEKKRITPADVREIMEKVRKHMLEQRDRQRRTLTPKCPRWRREEPCDRVSDFVRGLFDDPTSRRWTNTETHRGR